MPVIVRSNVCRVVPAAAKSFSIKTVTVFNPAAAVAESSHAVVVIGVVMFVKPKFCPGPASTR